MRMEINVVKLIYFSPTQTTRKVLEGISHGVHAVRVEHVDLTLPGAARQHSPQLSGDLALIGAPVYGGRLPSVFVSRFREIKGNGGPAVIVVVYGNRAYEYALLELWDLALERGFRPIAAGAFVGEHSYSTSGTPIAAGRPDREDLGNAKGFGGMIHEKMTSLRTLDQLAPLRVPGNFPYKELSMLAGISPATQKALCTGCQECAAVCPTAAIDLADPAVTDKSLCIRCCACIKICPAGARSMDDLRITQVAGRLHEICAMRKEPEMYL